MVHDPPPSVRVPDGFSVTVHTVRPAPGVERLPSGLVVAQFGAGSDEPLELIEVIERARAAAKLAGPRPRFATQARRVEDLLTPEPPSVGAAERSILWTCAGDGLRVMLDGGPRQASLVAELIGLPSLGLVIDAGWGAGSGVFAPLRAAGVNVWEAAAGGAFLVEVSRPDGARVHSLPVPDAAERPERPWMSPVWRSPRLRRVVLQTAGASSEGALESALVERTIPMVFITNPQGTPLTMRGPGTEGPVVPVFADLESLHRMASDSELGAGEYEVGVLAFGALMQWTDAQRFVVALGVFDDAGGLAYVPLSASRVTPSPGKERPS